jgi:hypothetical protein
LTPVKGRQPSAALVHRVASFTAAAAPGPGPGRSVIFLSGAQLTACRPAVASTGTGRWPVWGRAGATVRPRGRAAGRVGAAGGARETRGLGRAAPPHWGRAFPARRSPSSSRARARTGHLLAVRGAGAPRGRVARVLTARRARFLHTRRRRNVRAGPVGAAPCRSHRPVSAWCGSISVYVPVGLDSPVRPRRRKTGSRSFSRDGGRCKSAAPSG